MSLIEEQKVYLKGNRDILDTLMDDFIFKSYVDGDTWKGVVVDYAIMMKADDVKRMDLMTYLMRLNRQFTLIQAEFRSMENNIVMKSRRL